MTNSTSALGGLSQDLHSDASSRPAWAESTEASMRVDGLGLLIEHSTSSRLVEGTEISVNVGQTLTLGPSSLSIEPMRIDVWSGDSRVSLSVVQARALVVDLVALAHLVESIDGAAESKRVTF